MNRFRSTKLSREQWFRRLSPEMKCTWSFICDECDNAGMWPIDADAIEFFIGSHVNIDDFLDKINADRVSEGQPLRVERFGINKLWITGFCSFQYGELSNACIPHKKIILLLTKYDLLHRVPVRVQDTVVDRVAPTLQEKKRQERKGKEEENNSYLTETENALFDSLVSAPVSPAAPSKPVRRPNLIPIAEDDKPARSRYEALVESVKANGDIREQKQMLSNFITTEAPKFIEPYCDLWNLAASQYPRVPKIGTINDTRVKKFKSRIKEPAFDFLKILQEIKQSKYLQGLVKEWVVDWNWIMDNDSNYLNIIEGKYKNVQN